MPKLSQHALIWSDEHQHYELYTHGQLVFSFPREEDPRFSRWLAEYTAFAFVGQSGRLSVLKEARSNGVGYWYAYSTRARHSRKRYLGSSDRITFARLEQEATILDGSPSPTTRASKPLSPQTPALPSLREEREQAGQWTHATQQEKPWGELLSTKLSPPGLPVTLVERARLLDHLEAVHIHPLTLVSASAGSGKTTLLSAWVAASKHLPEHEGIGEGTQPAFAWLSLDALDNDPIRFWASVIAALRTCLPTIGETALALLYAQQAPPPTVILAHLLNEIGQIGRELMLILDDYHLIADPAIQQAMLFLLEHLPACMHLVLATRIDPELPLSRLRVRGQLLEIRDHDLRFSRTETTSFLIQRMSLPLADEDVATLERRTEGWIAGLHLAALALRKVEDLSAFVKDFAGTHRFVLDYVEHDILAQLPSTLQDFLLQTAILTTMNAALCQAVTALPTKQASQQMLEALEQANFFLVPLDEPRQWYRYHDLFREALCARLQISQPERVARLHHRAARWYEAAGELREAITHTLAASDHSHAAALMERAAGQFWLRGEAQIIHDWLQALPDAVLWQRVPLALEASLRLLNTFHASTWEVHARIQAQVERALVRIEGALHSRQQLSFSDAQRALVERRLRLLRALLEARAIFKHDGREGLRRLAREIRDLPQDEEMIWKVIPLSFTFWLTYSFLGGEAPLLPQLREAKQQARKTEDDLATMHVQVWLAQAYVRDGQLHRAHRECQEGLAWIAQTHGHTAMAGYLYSALFHVYYAWNRLEEAADILSRLIGIGQEWQQVDLLFVGEKDAGWLALAQGDFSAAQEALRRLENLQAQEGNVYQASWVQIFRLRWWLAQGDLRAASEWAAHTTHAPDTWGPLQAWDVFMRVRVAIAQQHYLQAAQMLARWSQFFDQPEMRLLTIEFLSLQVLALHHAGEREQARAVAARLFALTEPEGMVRVYLDEGVPMKQALQALLEAPQEEIPSAAPAALSQSYVRRLLAAFEQERQVRQQRGAAVPATTAGTLSPFPQRDGQPTLIDPLSPQERKVLHRLCAGQTYGEIAEELIVSPNTVKTQVSSIYRKLGVCRRAEAIAVTAQLHLLA